MYIPTWVDMPVLIASFAILYEVSRQQEGFRSVWDGRLILIVFTLIWAIGVIFFNQAGVWSVVLLVGALLSLAGALYFRHIMPRKLPPEPSFD